MREDVALLSEQYDVRTFQFGNDREKRRVSTVGGVGRQWRWLRDELPEADLVFGWFADYHMVLPVRMAARTQKPIAVVLGGFDANVVPEVDYGVYGSTWRAPLARYVIRNATLLLPVTDALIYHENRYAAFPQVLRNGVSEHIPGLRVPFVELPTGYDLDKWPMGPLERQPSVCSVAFLNQERTVRIKGIDLLIEAARRLDSVPFDIIGVSHAYEPQFRQRFDPPPNVRLHPPCGREELTAIYAQAAVYAQLSRSEGMPNVVAEAMACGCIPVCSAVAGMPALVGDTGVLVQEPDPDVIARAVRTALNLAVSGRTRARARIAACYSISARRSRLYEIVESLTAGKEPPGTQMATSVGGTPQATRSVVSAGSQS